MLSFIKEHVWQILLGLNYLLAVIAAGTILLKKVNPTKTITYIIVLLVFPFVGLVVYYLFGQEYRKTKIFDRKKVLNQKVIKRIKEEMELSDQDIKKVEEQLDQQSKVVELIYNSENSPLTINNQVEVLKNGEEKFKILVEDLNSAEHHIHLEYFIVKDDDLGRTILDILIEKSKDGLDIKLIVDDVGSKISSQYKSKLKESGVKLYPFMPVRFPKFTGKMNYRDHRKIVVIDGIIGYVGGINISNEYSNAKNDNYWRDTHLRIEGEAVKQLQILFLTTYNFVTSDKLKISDNYFPKCNDYKTLPIQIAASGPDTDWANIMEGIFSAITNAKSYIYITTPYFIPNDEIFTAIQIAAKSGVEVKLIVPKNSDSWIAESATNSYIETMLTANVEVYQYTKGFIHTKTMVVDDIFTTIGTANFDYRSFEINFEVNAFIYDKKVTEALKSQFKLDLKDSKKLNLDGWNKRSRFLKYKESVARLMAPLL
ncbi:MAG: cardiolipin synthase [Winogradskyella sp.]|nr:cardiolipin synthase [Winogradskyella sp.]